MYVGQQQLLSDSINLLSAAHKFRNSVGGNSGEESQYIYIYIVTNCEGKCGMIPTVRIELKQEEPGQRKEQITVEGHAKLYVMCH